MAGTAIGGFGWGLLVHYLPAPTHVVYVVLLAVFTVQAIGVLAILSRYLIWDNTNTPVLIGLAFLLGGLWVATKWR